MYILTEGRFYPRVWREEPSLHNAPHRIPFSFDDPTEY